MPAAPYCTTYTASALAAPQNGERFETNLTVSVFDETIPRVLGCPSAILQLVLFCHQVSEGWRSVLARSPPAAHRLRARPQEESNWPISDTSDKLKSKLDAIFESTRYTKAIDDIKKQRKAHSDTLHEVAQQLAALNERVSEAMGLQQERDELQTRQDALQEQQSSACQKADVLQARKNTLTAQLDACEQQPRKIAQLEAQCTEWTTRAEQVVQQAPQAQNLTPADLALSLLELSDMQERADAAVGQKRKELDAATAAVQAGLTQAAQADAATRAAEADHARARQAAEEVQRLSVATKQLQGAAAAHMAAAHQVTMTDTDAEDPGAQVAAPQVLQACESTLQLLASQQASLESDQAEREARFGEEQAKVVDAAAATTAQLALAQQQLQAAEQREHESSAKAAALQAQLQAQDGAAAQDMARAEQEAAAVLLSAEQHMQAVESQFDGDAVASQLQAAKRSKASLAAEKQACAASQQEVQALVRAAAAQDDAAAAAAQARRDVWTQFEQAAPELLNGVACSQAQWMEQGSQCDLPDSQVSPATLRTHVQREMKAAQTSLLTANKEYSSIAARCNALEERLSRANASVAKLSQAAEQSAADIPAEFASQSAEQLESCIASLRTTLQECEGRISKTMVELVLRAAQDVARESGSCGCCGQSCAAEPAAGQLDLQALAASVFPRLDHAVAGTRSSTEAALTAAQAAQAAVSRAAQANTALATGRQQQQQAQVEHDEASQQRVAAKQQLDAVQAEVDALSDRQGRAEGLQVSLAQLQAAEARLDKVQREVAAAAAAAGQDAAAAQAAVRELQAKVAALDQAASQADALVADLEQRLQAGYSAQRDARKRLDAARKAHTDAAAALQRSKQVAEQHAACLASAAAAHDQAQELKEKQAELQAARDTAQSQVQAVRDAQEAYMTSSRASVQALAQHASAIRLSLMELRSTIRAADALSIDAAQVALDNSRKRAAEAQASITAARRTQEVAQSALTDVQGSQRLMMALLQRRKYLDQCAAAEAELSTLRQGSVSTAAEITELRQQIEAVRDAGADARAAGDRALGKLEEVRARLQTVEAMLASSRLADVHEEFRESTIQQQVVQQAVTELGLYEKALDRALLQYHEQRLQAVNAALEGLWTNTYRGGDIDRICIASDKSKSSSTGRHTYKYSVQMVKGSVAMDMRGRCSAGQKVLASLCIRLALAETFCDSCGVLALDEPTTNLDEDNKRGLACAVVDLARSRASESNFQLLIITHDTEFVDQLGEAQRAAGDISTHRPQYLRVSRHELEDGVWESAVQQVAWG